VVHQFQDDLSALRIQLSILVSKFKKVTLHCKERLATFPFPVASRDVTLVSEITA
jgi:hypothetical protein